MEDPDLDQPSLHRIVPPLEGSLGRLVLTRRAVDRKERLRFDASLQLHRRTEGSVRLCRLL